MKWEILKLSTFVERMREWWRERLRKTLRDGVSQRGREIDLTEANRT